MEPILIVLGKNWKNYPTAGDASVELSIESKLSALAAGVLYTQGVFKKLLFSTGYTAGINYPSEGMAMVQYMKAEFPNIPDSDILLENNSIDTAGNVVESRNMLASLGYATDTMHVLTVSFHLLRSKRLFRHFGISMIGHSAEQVLRAQNATYTALIRNYHHSPRYWFEVLREIILNMLVTVDRKGTLLRLITKRVRN